MAKRVIFFLVVVVGICLWLYYTSRFSARTPEVVGVPAPDFSAATVDGQNIHLKDLLGKKVVLVNFWASWCEPCQEEVPLLNDVYDALKDENFAIISLMEDDETEEGGYRTTLEKFQKKIPIHFPVYIDKDQAVADTYGTYKIPESYLIDKSGKVIDKIPGSVTDDSKQALIEHLRDMARQ
jgi:peroxiredoxin